MILQMEATPVYLKTARSISKYRITCSEGGSRSSKTWSIFQFFIQKALGGEEGDVTIVREKLTWIKETLLKDFEEMCLQYGLPVFPNVNVNRPSQVYRINGFVFTFWGLDEPKKAHGKKQRYTWINEGMEISRKSFDQLQMRTTNKIVIDYNPSDDSHWIFDLQKRPDVGLIKSTMLDNPFVSNTVVATIKGYEPTPLNIAQGTADNYMWQVYGLGNKAKLQGVIYENWDIVDEVPKDANLKGYGMDFGYTNDPTALTAIYLFNNEVYADELIYEAALTNQDIISRLNDLLPDKGYPMYADSSEPKSIEEIARGGFNILPVTKGADSIKFGIDVLRGYKIHLTRRSINLDNERRKYKWAEDKDGKTLNKPIDKFNHGCDSIRYFAMMELSSQQSAPKLSFL